MKVVHSSSAKWSMLLTGVGGFLVLWLAMAALYYVSNKVQMGKEQSDFVGTLLLLLLPVSVVGLVTAFVSICNDEHKAAGIVCCLANLMMLFGFFALIAMAS